MAAGVLTLCTTSGFPGVFCAMFLSSSSSFLSSPALLLASHRVYVCLRKVSLRTFCSTWTDREWSFVSKDDFFRLKTKKRRALGECFNV